MNFLEKEAKRAVEASWLVWLCRWIHLNSWKQKCKKIVNIAYSINSGFSYRSCCFYNILSRILSLFKIPSPNFDLQILHFLFSLSVTISRRFIGFRVIWHWHYFFREAFVPRHFDLLLLLISVAEKYQKHSFYLVSTHLFTILCFEF